jgi:mannose-6-phosphate isomerase-like protein (cupin superfamily)
MTVTQRIKAKNAVDHGRTVVPAARAAVKKGSRIDKKETKVPSRATKGSTATSVKPVKHAGEGHPKKSDAVKISSLEEAAVRSIHSTVKKNVKKNEAKAVSHKLPGKGARKNLAEGKTISPEASAAQSKHDHEKMDALIEKNEARVAIRDHPKLPKKAGRKSTVAVKTRAGKIISHESSADAHSRHDHAKKSAQIVKNATKVASHNLHKIPGKADHRVSDEEKAVSLKAFSYEAKVEAHHPHDHTQASTRPSHEQTGAHKTGKHGFTANLEEETRKNKDFRRVLYTGKHCQLVLMCLKPMEDIGMEVHEDVDQFFRFEEGEGVVEIDGTKHAVRDGSGVIVPCGAMHNVTNTSETGILKLYTIYSPPEHQDKVVRKTKREALSAEEHFDGKTTEKFSRTNVHSPSVRSRHGADASLS